ncbi:MAG: L-2-amino-thiazoline-4-carboxylic acid hydrolase [Clostridiaceae bacterium]|nr:L-2-amino-thiazoline-4-carboxylic acid hydrolase [Clostridiaceae bacterium]
MKYGLLPRGIWLIFSRSFQVALADVLQEPAPALVMKKAKRNYRSILSGVNEFDHDDRFVINIISCAMLAAVLQSVENPYEVSEIQAYYEAAMDTPIMRFFATHSGVYTVKGQASMKRRAERSREITNPYSWKFTYEPGITVNQYSAIFSSCGICHLMQELGLSQYVPAMCAFDYAMNAMDDTKFSRKYTLASGGPCCDCHYSHSNSKNLN